MCWLKCDAGLGFRPLKLINQALLGNWLRRIGDGYEGLWKPIVLAKYGVGRHGWDMSDGNANILAIWGGCLSIKEDFMTNIRFRVGSGDRILLWFNVWAGYC